MIDADMLSSMEMIRDSARSIVKQGDLNRVRRLRHEPPGFDLSVWASMCEMGWPALRLSEEKGGSGLGLLAYCALAEELGKGLVPEPLILGSLSAALLKHEALEQHLNGERLVLPAWRDRRETLLPSDPLALQGGCLTAKKLYVPMACGADGFLVIGATQAALVNMDAPGVTIESADTQDGTTTAIIRLEKTPCMVYEIDPAPALAEATLTTSSYLLGIMEGALDLTLPYLRQRVQFGKAISQFQILQHMAVDLKLEIEVTRASIEAAALQWDIEGPTVAGYAAISRAKARASSGVMKVTRDAVQLHGGIGFTDEHDIGLYLRKAMVVAPQFGGASLHRKNFARLKPVAEGV